MGIREIALAGLSLLSIPGVQRGESFNAEGLTNFKPYIMCREQLPDFAVPRTLLGLTKKDISNALTKCGVGGGAGCR
jgi:hypothetical protein